mgnify:CR=1 FL=1
MSKDTTTDPIKEYQKDILKLLETYRRYSSAAIHAELTKLSRYSHFTMRDTIEALAYLVDNKKVKMSDDFKYKIGGRRN